MRRLLPGLAILAGLCLSKATAQTSTPPLSGRLLTKHQIVVAWSNAIPAVQLEQTSALSATNVWQAVSQAPVAQGAQKSVTLDASSGNRFFRLVAQALTRIPSTSPLDGEDGVSVNRETIVYFSAPLAPSTTLTTTNFFATFGGRRLLSRIELASDRHKATLFYLEPIPASARVNVVFDATG